ncbi:RsiV family protein [Ornithinibacillus scapharcae]|uniref:RsiV family protein n=1 Tax=Ornithinibacillus scapharcae TaxID=1147159 RepID=UPI000225B9D6|nr:DUF3298 domain-containing protein [Ornithinibacillus scapharcae]
MGNNKIDQLKKKYKEIPIPSELDSIVESALQKRSPKKHGIRWVAGIVAAGIIFTTSLNVSPTLAKSLEDIPVVGSIVNVLVFKEYRVEEGNYQADIKVPAIDKLENKALEESLNEKYLAESQELYDKFMSEMESQQAFGQDGHLQVDSGFLIKTETDQLLSIGRYVEEIVASSAVTIQYDTIDKENQLLVTLPSLFKDDSYVEVISNNILSQMKEQMKEDPNKMYFIESPDVLDTDVFTTIKRDQNFYINPNNQLVISFDEYEVAPGYMGVTEFVIPTKELEDILVSNQYLK